MNTETLWKVQLKDLQTFLKANGKPNTGLKADLVRTLIDSGLGEKFAAEYPDSREDEAEAAAEPEPVSQPTASASAPAKKKVKEDKQKVAPKPKEYTTAELANMERPTLYEICVERGLPVSGNRDALITRIYTSQTENPPDADQPRQPRAKKAKTSVPVSNDNEAEAPAPAPTEGVGECAVCMENKAQCVMIPCGHVCVCKECNDDNSFDTCLICRQPVDMVTFVYINFTDENPKPNEKEKKEKKLNTAVDSGIRPLPKAWEGVLQPACFFQLYVPWDESAIEEQLVLRCLLCEKWATDPEAHGTMTGSKDHKKKLDSMADPTVEKWFKENTHTLRQTYLDRYPVLRRVPFENEPVDIADDVEMMNVSDEEVEFMGQKCSTAAKLTDLDFLEKISKRGYPSVTLELFPFEQE